MVHIFDLKMGSECSFASTLHLEMSSMEETLKTDVRDRWRTCHTKNPPYTLLLAHFKGKNFYHFTYNCCLH